MLDVTYGVLNYNPSNNKEAELAFRRCLESLNKNKSQCISSEVYVIDQASEENLQQLVVQEYCNNYKWKSILLEKNVGISRGINLLANVARGRYICLVTSDVIFTEGLDVSLIKTLQDNPNIWQICPASDNSSLQHQKQGYKSSGLAYTLAAQELTVQMWPRSTFEKIGYFDERWKACFENMDYAMRIFLAGGNIAVSHDTFCPHEHGMCIKSGARNKTYDNYIQMSNGFNQDTLHQLWNNKWSGLDWSALYEEPPNEDGRKILHDTFKDNIYLGYIQDIEY